MVGILDRPNYYECYENMTLIETLGCKERSVKASLVMSAAKDATNSYKEKMRANNDSRSDKNLFNVAMHHALKLIDQLQCASGKDDDDNFWTHKSATDVKKMIDNNDIQWRLLEPSCINDIVTTYVYPGSSIRFRAFDRISMDMLIASELFNILRHAKAHSGVAGFLFGNKRFKKEMVRCGGIASGVYCEIGDHGVLSPTYIKGLVLTAQTKGIVWPGSLHVLLDDVIQRGSTL
jgi:hypothetical protein